MNRTGIKPGHPVATSLLFLSFATIFICLGLLAITISAPLNGTQIVYHSQDLLAAAGAVLSVAVFFVCRHRVIERDTSHEQLRIYTRELIREQRASRRLEVEAG